MDRELLSEIVRRAIAEDLGSGDVTSEATVPRDAQARATVTQKAPGVVFGVQAAEATFLACDSDAQIRRTGPEGTWRDGGQVLEITGDARALLAAERTALNFLQRLSGIATLTARCVQQTHGAGPHPPVKILDTRKTTPGLRLLEKEAVLAGGGTNHRTGLYDAILIKENHVALAGGVAEAVRLAREHAPNLPLEVECRDLADVDQALQAGAPRILLDNMTPERLREAVQHVAGRAELEASGGFTLETIREVAATGVDFISVGALTHSAPALDLSLLLETLP